MYEIEKKLLPEFPRTRHLPFEPNASRDDVVATQEELRTLLGCGEIYVEEKVDGSNCGITLHEGLPVIRNRTHILNKAYTGGGKGHPAKEQFTRIWTWFYDHRDRWEKLATYLGWMPSVYGEWLYARHTVPYDALPDLFVPYDLYNPQTKQFLNTRLAREALSLAGFALPTLLLEARQGSEKARLLKAESWLPLRDGPSTLSAIGTLREGVYVKGCDSEAVRVRMKMVSPHFQSDDRWAKKSLVKNALLVRARG